MRAHFQVARTSLSVRFAMGREAHEQFVHAVKLAPHLMRTHFQVARTFLSVRFAMGRGVRGQECPRHQVNIGKESGYA